MFKCREVFASVVFDLVNDRIEIDYSGLKYVVDARPLRGQFPNQALIHLIAKAIIIYSSETLELIRSWLQWGLLEPLDPDDEELAKARLLEYIKLYRLSSDEQINRLMNAIMDRIRARPTCGDGYFPAFFIEECYKSSTPDSPLRRYLVDSFVFKTKTWDAPRHVDMIRHHLEASHHNQQFVVDCDKKKTDNMERRLIGQDPNKKHRCEYHVHAAGSFCR